MAVSTTFKQECPTCGATVKVDEKMLGKKVECTKCKDKFVAEKPDDEEDDAPRGKKKAAANGKKTPKPDDDDVADVEFEEDDADEAPQVKASKGKAGANGKAKPHDEDEESDDEPEEKAKRKSKKDGGSNKLTIGLALAVVGVLLLGIVGYVLMAGGRRPIENSGPSSPTKPGKRDDAPEKKETPVTPVETKIEPSTVPLDDAEIAKLTNLLPNDTEYVFHLFFKEIFGPSGSLHEAVFKTDGALDNVTMTRRLGFSLASVDDAIRAERYSAPSWKYSVIHFRDALDEKKLKAALNLKLGGAPIDGQTYYKMTEPHPVFDVLGRFSFGIPNWLRYLEPRRPEQPTFVRLHNAQTLIVGDEAPVMALLKHGGQMPLLSARTAPPPAPAPTPTPGPTTPGPTTPGPTTPGPTAPDGKTEGESKKPTPKMMPGPKGGMKGRGAVPGGSSQLFPQVRPESAFAESSSFRFQTTPVLFASFEQAGGQQGDGYLASKLPATSWRGSEKPPASFLTLAFSAKGELTITSELFMVMGVPGDWRVTPNNVIEVTSARIPGITYQIECIRPGELSCTGRNQQGGAWTFVLAQTDGLTFAPQTAGDAGKQAPASPGAAPTPGATPGSTKSGSMLVYEDRYLTIPPALKTVLDRMESRSADNPERVLLSSTANMEKNRIETSLPEFRDRVVRRPRQFWDITVLLDETTLRIRTLGTALLQRGETQRYQFRNEIGCDQETEAAAIKKEITETTSFKVAQFVKKLVNNHEVRLPELPAKEPKKAPAPDPKTKGKAAEEKKKSTQVNVSHMTVKQQAGQPSNVDFVLELVLDNAALTQVNSIAALVAGAVRAETEAAASPSIRHMLAKADKMAADKGMPDRDVPPGRFPPGAFPRTKTPSLINQEPRNRISWMASLLPHMGQWPLYHRLQFDQSWREPANWMAGHTIVPQFLDPSYPDYLRRVSIDGMPLDLGATHYVGVAGIGLDAASYSRNDPATAHKRGIFSYDGSASLDEIQKGRGLSNTIAIIQIPHDGVTGVSPWIAGGGATLRGVPEKNSIAPFILSRDKNDKPIEHQGKRGTFVMMADGSVRFVDQTVSDDVFKAMATVQGPAPANFNPGTNPSTPLVPAPQEGAEPEAPPQPKIPEKTGPAKPDEPPQPKVLEKTAPVKDASGKLVVQGKCSIDAPPGFAWKFLQEMKVGPTSAKVYLCTSSKSQANVVLAINDNKVESDEQKRQTITQGIAQAENLLKTQGFDMKADKQPALKSPIPERVDYRLKGTAPNGGMVFMYIQVIFGRSTFSITVTSTSEAEANDLFRIAQTFKE